MLFITTPILTTIKITCNRLSWAWIVVYIANADKVNVYGLKLTEAFRPAVTLPLWHSCVTDAKYIVHKCSTAVGRNGFNNCWWQMATPCSWRSKIFQMADCLIVSKWAGSVGGEFNTAANFFRQSGKFLAFDAYYRSEFSSSPSPSKFWTLMATPLWMVEQVSV